MYEVIIENSTGKLSLKFKRLSDAQSFCLLFAESAPFDGDRRSTRIYKGEKLIDHDEWV